LGSSRAEGIEVDVANQLRKVGIFVADDGFVTVLEEVAGAVVAEVEGDGVAGEEPAHELGEGGHPGAVKEVVRHERPREALHRCLLEKELKPSEEIPAVLVVGEYFAALCAANDDVLEQAGNVDACGTWHMQKINKLCG
jgi:hypothetical protein